MFSKKEKKKKHIIKTSLRIKSKLHEKIERWFAMHS